MHLSNPDQQLFFYFYQSQAGPYHRRKPNPFLHTPHIRIIRRRQSLMAPDQETIKRTLLLEGFYRLLLLLSLQSFILGGN